MQVSSERQEMFKSTIEDKLRLQSRITEKYQDQMFEKIKELEEKKSEEALPMVQKKYELWRDQNERNEARRLYSGNSRRVRKGMDLQHPFSSKSCRSSTVDHDEEMTLESPRKRQEVQEVMKETAVFLLKSVLPPFVARRPRSRPLRSTSKVDRADLDGYGPTCPPCTWRS